MRHWTAEADQKRHTTPSSSPALTISYITQHHKSLLPNGALQTEGSTAILYGPGEVESCMDADRMKGTAELPKRKSGHKISVYGIRTSRFRLSVNLRTLRVAQTQGNTQESRNFLFCVLAFAHARNSRKKSVQVTYRVTYTAPAEAIVRSCVEPGRPEHVDRRRIADEGHSAWKHSGNNSQRRKLALFCM